MEPPPPRAYSIDSTGPVVYLEDDLALPADHALNVYLIARAGRAKKVLTVKLPGREAYHALHRRRVYVRVRNESEWVDGASDRGKHTVWVELGDGFIGHNNALKRVPVMPERAITFVMDCAGPSLGPNMTVPLVPSAGLNEDATDPLQGAWIGSAEGYDRLRRWCDDDRVDESA